MTDDRMLRFAQWQDGLTLDIVEKSIPAIADDLAGDLKACGPTCCDRINDSHGV